MKGTLTWSALLSVACGELDCAADGWGRLSNRADAARDRIDQQILTGLRETQEGEAADAALDRLRRLARNLQYSYTETGLVRTALNSLAHEVRTHQKSVREALEEAESLRFTVHPDGSVSYPEKEGLVAGKPLPGGKTPVGRGFPDLMASSATLTAPNPHAATAQDIADRIARAVALAADADMRYASILRELKAEDSLDVPDSTWTDAAADMASVRDAARAYLNDHIPYRASAAERKEWWSNLPPELRDEYLATYPDIIGNLDGIPALVRDAANRDSLQLLIGKLAGAEGGEAAEKLEALRLIDQQLHAPLKPGDPPMYLLGIGDEGNGRAIVAYGNPDASKNVAAYVPGLDTGLDAKFATNDLKRARDTAIGARYHNPSSAAIAWLGYDAPQSYDGWSSLAVAGSDRADKGGDVFSHFMDGISTTNQDGDPHLTAIGHSYGSRTVGSAARETGGIPGVSDIVLVGSPGVGVERAEELGLGREHVFVGAAENDPVTKLPSKGRMISGVAGFQFMRNELWFGRDPASAEFGARRFQVDEGPELISSQGFAAAHSNYFSPERDAVSAGNIALIVAGRSEKIRSQGYR
ncbi:alpha/beta hydrolase [Streptomyces sp. NBC_00102]|uniref:alpha/beta hydrolase n=1 Tax=Streptomyces sp. NBC_00102 TaxID=2975652 RepID=UPI002254B4EF|nr:alpha/beta hydrolase [Streptomyces sp. NBC_00102]MCX5398027.1 alpha/beta hydrolase family protein [Streptomyces sp. NBC_00102]